MPTNTEHCSSTPAARSVHAEAGDARGSQNRIRCLILSPSGHRATQQTAGARRPAPRQVSGWADRSNAADTHNEGQCGLADPDHLPRRASARDLPPVVSRLAAIDGSVLAVCREDCVHPLVACWTRGVDLRVAMSLRMKSVPAKSVPGVGDLICDGPAPCSSVVRLSGTARRWPGVIVWGAGWI